MSLNIEPSQYLDLKGIACPLNFIRCRIALESLKHDEILLVDIDKGEPEEMLIPGLRKEGYSVDIQSEESTWIRLMVTSFGK